MNHQLNPAANLLGSEYRTTADDTEFRQTIQKKKKKREKNIEASTRRIKRKRLGPCESAYTRTYIVLSTTTTEKRRFSCGIPWESVALSERARREIRRHDHDGGHRENDDDGRVTRRHAGSVPRRRRRPVAHAVVSGSAFGRAVTVLYVSRVATRRSDGTHPVSAAVATLVRPLRTRSVSTGRGRRRLGASGVGCHLEDLGHLKTLVS